MSKTINKLQAFFNKIFKKEKTYQLPEPKDNPYKKISHTFLDYKSSENFVSPELESSIMQFLSSYYELADLSDKTAIPAKPYDALIRINGGPKCYSQKNITDENNLFASLKNNNSYTLKTNYSQNGDPVFYHIQSSNYKLPDKKDMIRIYLNCKPENIAELATNILQKNNEDNFYLKFASTIENYKYPRSEKIVIYTDQNHYSNTVSSVNNLICERPDLFEFSQNVNPFGNQINQYMTYGFEPQVNYFTKLNGSKINANSHNKMISLALEDSYMESAKEIAKQDSKLDFLLSPDYSNDSKLFIQNLPYLESNYHNYLINSMANKLKQLSYINGLKMRGIDFSKNQYTNQNLSKNNDEYYK